MALPALAAITLFGVLLRAWRIDDFWLSADEATYYFSTLGDWQTAQERIRVNAHPPLYYWILFGLAKCNGSLLALRLTSLISGVLCIPAMYLLGRSFAGRTAALSAAVLVAVSPGALFLSQVMRPYSMQLLFLILGLAGLARYVATSRTRWLVLHSVCFLVALFLHYSSLIPLAGVGACIVWLSLRRGLDLGLACRLFLAEVPILAGAGWLFVSHIRPTLMGGGIQANVRETWLSHGFLSSPLQLGDTLLDTLLYLFGRPADHALLAALPVGLWACVHRRAWVPLLFACATSVAAVLLSFLGLYPLLGHRHCIYLLALLAPVAGIGLEHLLVGRRRPVRWLGVALAATMAASVAHMPKILDRNWDGAERAPENAVVEQVRETLDSNALEGATLLTDAATGVLLACIYRAAREDYEPIERGGPVYSLDLGGHRFYCLRGSYRLGARSDQRGEANHLEGLLAGLERLAGKGLVPALRERVWIVQTGYALQAQHVLPLTLPDGTFLRSQRIGGPSFAAIEVDREAYRRYLEE